MIAVDHVLPESFGSLKIALLIVEPYPNLFKLPEE